MKAIFNGVVIAESPTTVIVEGNHYFPPNTVKMKHFTKSSRHTVCPWKSTTSYYNIVANGETSENAAWYYPDTSERAAHIKGHVAFYPVVQVVK